MGILTLFIKGPTSRYRNLRTLYVEYFFYCFNISAIPSFTAAKHSSFKFSGYVALIRKELQFNNNKHFGTPFKKCLYLIVPWKEIHARMTFSMFWGFNLKFLSTSNEAFGKTVSNSHQQPAVIHSWCWLIYWLAVGRYVEFSCVQYQLSILSIPLVNHSEPNKNKLNEPFHCQKRFFTEQNKTSKSWTVQRNLKVWPLKRKRSLDEHWFVAGGVYVIAEQTSSFCNVEFG